MPQSCILADNDTARDLVFRVRYSCYHRNGAISDRPDQRFRDRYDELPNHFSFLMRPDHLEEAATVRISVVRPDRQWLDCPSRSVFADHPAFIEIAKTSFVEASRLCFGRQATRDSFHRLVANLAAMAELHQTPWVVACPREEHTSIYARMFGFKTLAEPRPYYGVNFKTGLMAISLENLRERAARYKSMQSSWQSALAHLATVTSLIH